jgi:flagellar biosynthesis/type III secretory pathway protein FliH
MKMLRTLLFGLACSLPMLAAAQWQWVGKDGRKVFSDQPPPQDIPAASILKQPGPKRQPAVAPVAAEPAAEPASAPSAAKPPAGAPKISGKDKALEERKKQAEAAEAAKLQEEKDKIAKARAENCARAKQAKLGYDSGLRIARTNAKGEREIMDEAARAAEVKRLDGIVSSECKVS